MKGNFGFLKTAFLKNKSDNKIIKIIIQKGIGKETLRENLLFYGYFQSA